jgi:hypothetical protein
MDSYGSLTGRARVRKLLLATPLPIKNPAVLAQCPDDLAGLLLQ